MTKPSAKAEAPHNSGATSILVWNGLVTRMRLIGGEKRSRARVDVDSSLIGRRAPSRCCRDGADRKKKALLRGAK